MRSDLTLAGVLVAVTAVAGLGALASGSVASCSPKPPPADKCPPPHPTFELTVVANPGPLPGDVRLTVRYGSGVEDYLAAHPNMAPQVVFCESAAADGGPDGAGTTDCAAAEAGSPGDAAADGTLPEGGAPDGSTASDAGAGPWFDKIVCKLWTDGPATVKVKASGYADRESNLVPATDECGLVLTQARLTLEKGD
jgi:hypothetical protein